MTLREKLEEIWADRTVRCPNNITCWHAKVIRTPLTFLIKLWWTKGRRSRWKTERK